MTDSSQGYKSLLSKYFTVVSSKPSLVGLTNSECTEEQSGQCLSQQEEEAQSEPEKCDLFSSSPSGAAGGQFQIQELRPIDEENLLEPLQN